MDEDYPFNVEMSPKNNEITNVMLIVNQNFKR